MDMLVRKHPMPEIADFVAKLRDAFGDATIDDAVAQGKAGEPTFFAQENGEPSAQSRLMISIDGKSTVVFGTGDTAKGATVLALVLQRGAVSGDD